MYSKTCTDTARSTAPSARGMLVASPSTTVAFARPSTRRRRHREHRSGDVDAGDVAVRSDPLEHVGDIEAGPAADVDDAVAGLRVERIEHEPAPAEHVARPVEALELLRDRPRRRRAGSSARLYPRPVPRPVVWSLYALLVLVWSSTWVAIKIGLEDLPAAVRRRDPVRARGRRPARLRRAAPPAAAHRPAPGDDPRRAAVRHHLRPHLLGRAAHPLGADRRAVRRPAALRRAARRGHAARRAPARPACCSASASRSPASRWRSTSRSSSATTSSPASPRPRSSLSPLASRGREHLDQAARRRCSTRWCSTAGRCSAAARCCSPDRP